LLELRARGKVQQARELLAPVFGWLPEGFDTLELRQAQALLDELARRDEGTSFVWETPRRVPLWRIDAIQRWV
jgi:predicted ATPase